MEDPVLAQILDMMGRIEKKLDCLSKLAPRVAAIEQAFVGTDFDGHRRAHEDNIKSSKKREDLWNSALKDALRVIVVAVVVFVASALWYYGTKTLRS